MRMQLLKPLPPWPAFENEFGRTTDPVRMYMREMGTVDLLTREGEIKIAKRIEEGLNQVLAALACYPGTINFLLQAHEQVELEQLKLSDIVIGINDFEEEYPDEGLPPAEQVNNNSNNDDSDGDDDDDEPEATLDPEEVKSRIKDITKLFNKVQKYAKRYGRSDKKTEKTQVELSDKFLEFTLITKTD